MSARCMRIPAPRQLTSLQAHSLSSAPRAACSQQRRWARVHDVRLLATAGPRLSIAERYRGQLDRKARAEGHAGIDELKAAYADEIEAQRRRDAASLAREAAAAAAARPGQEQAQDRLDQDQDQDQDQKPGEPPRPASSPAAFRAAQPTPTADAAAAAAAAAPPPPSVKPLSAMLDLAKARALPVPELTAVWRLRHAAQANSLCAVVPAHAYAAMEAAARGTSAQFVLPVPHEGQGAELHFLQWTFDAPTRTATVLFTTLAEYKAKGEFAAPHTTVTHYRDLEDRGVVLMHGTVMDGTGVSLASAQWLVASLQRFYGGWEAETDPARRERAVERGRLLEWFARGDERFTVEKLLEEAERLG